METLNHGRRSSVSSQMRTPRAYRICDGMTEAVLYFHVVFPPWAFGATERWSVWTMNAAGYALGALLFAKWWIRWRVGYRPPRWGENENRVLEDGGGQTENVERGDGRRECQHAAIAKRLTFSLAALTVLVLAYCLISSINARSTFVSQQMAFVPHGYIAWLPHSYDSSATWQAFWMDLGLALSFWAGRDWLLGKTAKERRGAKAEGRVRGADAALRAAHWRIPTRLQRLLWILCLNGALLALEGILQRLSGTGKLLWLLQPFFNQTADLQFGPYAYRSNAAQYFNMLWPVCLGFWWTLRRANRLSTGARSRMGGGAHVMLLPCAVLLAAAPIISTSRGGAMVAAGLMIAALGLLMFAQRRRRGWMRLGTVFLFGLALTLAGRLGWEKLGPRLKTISSDDMSGRVEIYRNAEQMARDFPLFGTGPGTFPSVYHLYRANSQATWAAYAHNDWLETRITFGLVGFALLTAALGMVLFRWLGDGGIASQPLFVCMIWLALAGCLIHARFDFPFQIYSTLGLFLQLCMILFCLSRKGAG